MSGTSYVVTVEDLDGRILRTWRHDAKGPRLAVFSVLQTEGYHDASQDGGGPYEVAMTLGRLGCELAPEAGARLSGPARLVDFGDRAVLSPNLPPEQAPRAEDGVAFAPSRCFILRVATAAGKRCAFTAEIDVWTRPERAQPRPASGLSVPTVDELARGSRESGALDLAHLCLLERGWTTETRSTGYWTYDPAQAARAKEDFLQRRTQLRRPVSAHERASAARDAETFRRETAGLPPQPKIVGVATVHVAAPTDRSHIDAATHRRLNAAGPIHTFDAAPSFALARRVTAREVMPEDVEAAKGRHDHSAWNLVHARSSGAYIVVSDGETDMVWAKTDFRRQHVAAGLGPDGERQYVMLGREPVYVLRFAAAGAYHVLEPRAQSLGVHELDAGDALVSREGLVELVKARTFARDYVRFPLPGVALCSAAAPRREVEAAAAALLQDPAGVLRDRLPTGEDRSKEAGILVREIERHLAEAAALEGVESAWTTPQSAASRPSRWMQG